MVSGEMAKDGQSVVMILKRRLSDVRFPEAALVIGDELITVGNGFELRKPHSGIGDPSMDEEDQFA
jgi:hypothetical protein